jgi:serine phosphatase RsbU (regulator of sigma subunit)/anti-sigma regulatory factor (Ser/Thr protein kinase)
VTQRLARTGDLSAPSPNAPGPRRRGLTGLGGRLLGWFVIVVVALSAVGGLLAWRKYRGEHARVRDETLLEARSGANQIDGWMSDQMQTLRSMAASITFRDQDVVGITQVFDRLGAGNAGFTAGIGWVDPKGTIRVVRNDSPAVLTELAVGDRSYFSEVMATSRPYVDNAFVGRASGFPVVVLAVPTFGASGNINGVLSASIRLEDLRDRAGITAPDRQNLVVIDRAGTIIVSRDSDSIMTKVVDAGAAEQLRGAPSSVHQATSITSGTGDFLVASATSPNGRWLILVQEPASLAFGRAWDDFVIELLLLGAIVVGAVLLGIGSARRIDRLHHRVLGALDAERDARAETEAAHALTESLVRVTTRLVQSPTVMDTVTVAQDEMQALMPGAYVTLVHPTADGLHLRVDTSVPRPPMALEPRWFSIPKTSTMPFAKVYSSGRPMYSSTREEIRQRWLGSGFENDVEGFGTAAACVLPLMVAGRVVGVLSASFVFEREFAPAERAQLATIASLLAQNLDRADAFESEHRANRKLAQLRDAIAAVAASDGFEASARAVVEHVRAAVGADGCALGLADERHDQLRLVATTGAYDAELRSAYDGVSLSARNAACLSYRTASTVRVREPREWVRRFPDTRGLPDSGARSTLAVPLDADRPLGTLVLVFSDDLPLNADDVSLVEAFASQAGQALERARALDAERTNREQLQLLSTLGSELESSTTIAGRVESFVRTIVPDFADMMQIELVNAEGDVREVFLRHRDPRAQQHWETLHAERVARGAAPLVSGIARNTGSVILPTLDGVEVPDSTVIDEFGVGSIALTPLRVHGALSGALAVLRTKDRPGFSTEDAALVDEISRRLSLALDNAQLYEREHELAETLQRSLLPERLPAVPGLEISSLYRPGIAGLHVGGDWYDITELQDGRIALTIGDVVGRGERAAVTMGRLRTLLGDRLLSSSDPGEVITYLDRVLVMQDEMATALVAVLDLTTGELVYSAAGHLPPLVVQANGEASFLPLEPSLPLGVGDIRPRKLHHARLDRGSTIVLFTDGLVERRRESIDVGLQRLADAGSAMGAVDAAWSARLTDQLVGASGDDDIAVLAVQLVLGPIRQFSLDLPAQPQQLATVRTHVRRWLSTIGADDGDSEALVLAVNEAAANVITHAYGPAGGVLLVSGSLTGGEIELTVSDHGTWRRRKSATGGHGLSLIDRLTDTHSVQPTPTGTIVQMRRHLREPASNAAGFLAGSSIESGTAHG